MISHIERDLDDIFDLLCGAPVGTRVYFQPLLKKDIRIAAELIGMEKDQLLIFKVHKLHSDFSFEELESGMCGVVRFLNEDVNGICIAFRTEIICTIKFPSELVFFKFPAEIETCPVRSHRRVNITFPAQISAKNTKNDFFSDHLTGDIVNISSDGCAFKTLNKPNVEKLNNTEISIEIRLCAGDIIKANGLIKSCRIKEKNVCIGIKFLDSDENLGHFLNHLGLDD